MDLFELMAKITLDTSEYEDGLDKSEEQAEGFGKKLKSGLGTAAKVSGVALGAVATGAAAVGTAMVKGAGEVASYGDNIDKMSQKMGISAEAYQEWDAILQHSGSSIDGMQKGMMTLSNAAFNGSDAFEKLGLSQEEVASMNQEELFAATIKGLQGMDEGAERTALAQKLLGGAAKELGPLLNTSAEETEAMRKRVHELGGVMSGEAVKAAAKYQDSLQDMQTSISGMKNSIFSTFMPGITSVMDGLTDIFSGDSDSGVGKINDGISDMITKISDGLPKVIEIGGQVINGLMQAITDNLPTIIEQGAVILLNLITGIVEQLPQLIEMAPQIISGLVKAIIAATPALLKAGWEVVKALLNGISNAYTMLLDAGHALIEKIKTGISNAFTGLKNYIGDKFKSLKEKITGPFEDARETVKGIIDRIKELFSFNVSLPHIRMPHFSWSWTDLGVIKIPNISVEWYKKAYDNPYIFDTPTVIGNKGFGDGNGAEMVYGKNSLMRDIKQAMSEGLDDSPITIVVQSVLDGRVIGETAYQYSLKKARANG